MVGVWFVKLGHFDKHFQNMSKTQKTQENIWKTQEKEIPQGNILDFFS